jgi:hypothetical protein
MSVIARSTAVAAGASNSNLVSGSAFEYPQQPSQVSLGCIASATGTFATVYAGSRLIMEEAPPYVAATTYPVVPDQMFLNFLILPGERLVIAVRNPTAGSITFGLMVEMTPVRV